MIRKNIRSAAAAAAAALLLCSCGNNGMTKKFAALYNAAESKSGIIYKTTFYEETKNADCFPYPEKDSETGKYRFVYDNEGGKTVPLTGFFFDGARTSYSVAETYFFAPAETDGKWGYVLLNTAEPDLENVTWEIEAQYENAEAFSEQLAAVKKDGKYGMINENGELVIPFMYDSIKQSSYASIPVVADGECYFINSANERILGPFEDGESYFYGFAAVKKNGKWGFIDKNGFDATAFVYDEAYSVDDEGGAWVRAGKKWEYVKVRK